MNFSRYITLLLIGLAGLLAACQTNNKRTPTDILERKSEPNDFFFSQRSYPDESFDVKAYKAAIAETKSSIERKTATVPSNLTWFDEGPGNIGGRINEVLVHPSNPDTMYVGNASGGVFKTVDGGANWYPIFDDFSYLAIGEITFDPQNPEILYVGTGDPNISGYPFFGDGIYKSINGGESWSHLGLAEVGIISRIEVHPTNPNIIFVAAMGVPYVRDVHRGVYKTVDGGANWSKVLYVDDDAGIIDMVLNPSNPNVIYAASWNRIRNNSESVVYGNDAKIHKSIDGGANWTALSGGLPVGSQSRIGLAMSAINPDLIYAIYTNTSYQVEGIYKSINGGNSWIPFPPHAVLTYAYGGFGWYFGQIRVSPYNDDELFLLGVDLYKTTDAGNTWFSAGPNWATYQFHADKHDLIYVDSLTVLCATDGGLYKSSDGGNNWVDIENIPNCQFYRVAVDPFEEGYYAGGLQDNGTTYGGQSDINGWQRLNGGDGFQILFDYNDPNIRYSESQNGSLYASTGGNWQYFGYGINSADRRSWDAPFIMSSHSSSVLYTGTHLVYKNSTAPTGMWSPISPDLTDGINTKFHVITTVAESPLDSMLLYAGTSDGNVWRSANGGSSWDPIYTGLPDRYVTHVIASPNFVNGVFVGHSGYRDGEFIPHIHYSNDYGNTWQDVSGDLPQLAVNNIHPMLGYADLMVFVATDGGVFSTDNGGVKWAPLGKNMPIVPVYDIAYDDQKNKLIAGTFGRSMMSISVDSMFTVLNTPLASVENNGLQLFPNPATDFISIGAMEYTSIRIYSLNGSLLKELSDFTNARIAIHDLPKGHFILEATNIEGKRQTGRFVKLY